MEFFKQAILFVVIFGVLGMQCIEPGYAEEKTWTYNGVEYRLPKPAADVQLPADIPETHTVVSGDCLWAISSAYLKDPYLWPLVWEENLETLSNPHRIYPGDIVRLPGGTLIATESLPPIAPMTPMTETGEPGPQTDTTTADSSIPKTPFEPKPFSVTSETDLIASGFITPEKVQGHKIIASETNSFDLAMDDIIFVESDGVQNLEVDANFFILREKRVVNHPISNRKLGRMYHVMGEARILCVNDSLASARITKSYHAILRGDILIPRQEIPIPLTFGTDPIDICNPSSKRLPGTIVDSFAGEIGFADAVILAKGDIAYIDLGSQDGVAPGDYFTIFKRDMDDPRLPRFVSGEAMVIKVQEATSVVVITTSRTAIFLGDQIELK
ncbi:LysM peptidoglycan-binding domain-containing protein [bacterium]|nr:LysM peptidoglycan-binding domain-containing protein [candidate division CSSED10-310 bacterium]